MTMKEETVDGDKFLYNMKQQKGQQQEQKK